MNKTLSKWFARSFGIVGALVILSMTLYMWTVLPVPTFSVIIVNVVMSLFMVMVSAFIVGMFWKIGSMVGK